MIVALIVLIAAVVALLAEAWRRSTHGLMAQRRRRRVVVTTTQGDTFAGVLLAADSEVLVLVSAELLRSDQGSAIAIDGELIVLREAVAYLQRP